MHLWYISRQILSGAIDEEKETTCRCIRSFSDGLKCPLCLTWIKLINTIFVVKVYVISNNLGCNYMVLRAIFSGIRCV